MFRIDHATAAASLPAFGAEGTPGFFTDGVPGASAATVVPAWWLNMVQEEITQAIESAGLTPDKADPTQLTQAIEAIALGVGGSSSTVNVSSSTVLTAGLRKLVFVDASAANIVITLPAANGVSAKAQDFRFIRSDNSSHTVSIARAGADTIEGAAATSLYPGDRLDLIGDGVSAWLQAARPTLGRLVAAVSYGYYSAAITVHRAFNVSGVTRLSAGRDQITFQNALPGTDYLVVAHAGSRTNLTPADGSGSGGDDNTATSYDKATTGVKLGLWHPNLGIFEDASFVTALFFQP